VSSQSVLETFVLEDAQEISVWCLTRFSGSTECSQETWILKDALANGGEGIFILNPRSWRLVVAKVLQREVVQRLSTEYVLQRYVENPMLWQGLYKFHYRCFCALTGDLRFYVFKKAFRFSANAPFNMTDLSNTQAHITNASANVTNKKCFQGYPMIDLSVERPGEWRCIITSMSELLAKAAPFLRDESKPDHFILLGGDFLPEACGTCVHLLEFNVPPCLNGFSETKDEENAVNALVDSMMADLVELLVLPPILGHSSELRDWHSVMPAEFKSRCNSSIVGDRSVKSEEDQKISWEKFKSQEMKKQRSAWRVNGFSDHLEKRGPTTFEPAGQCGASECRKRAKVEAE